MTDENEKEYHLTRQPSVSMFLNIERFEFAQRIGKMLAAATMIPDQYRNNLGNCLIALNLAEPFHKLFIVGLFQEPVIVHVVVMEHHGQLAFLKLG